MPVEFRERHHSQVLPLLFGLSWGRDVHEKVTKCDCTGVIRYEPVIVTNMNCWQNERNRAQQFFVLPAIVYYNYIFELTTFI